jgi:uncharacterized protein
MVVPAPLSLSAARRLALGAQALAAPRPRSPAGAAQLRRLMTGLGTIQLDAVNFLERTQYIVPFSRLGPYAKPDLLALCGPGGACFEYWGHAASLLPIELYPLFRWRMERMAEDRLDSPASQRRRQAWRHDHAAYLAAVLAEVAERGPLAASQLSDPRRRAGEWWDRRSDGRRALEVLFSDGVLSAWRSASFERVYDLTERALPATVLEQPVPPVETAQRELVAVAARCLGVATVTDLADYFWMKPGTTALRVAELLEDGRLEEVAVEGWGRPAYMAPGARPPRLGRSEATLLSPFDSLIWARPRTERLFGARYRIEIYVPAPQRIYGYYVLPLLWQGRVVARFDLKADRTRKVLLVSSAHLEPGEDAGDVAVAAGAELERMCAWLGLVNIVVGPAGELAPALTNAVGAR